MVCRLKVGTMVLARVFAATMLMTAIPAPAIAGATPPLTGYLAGEPLDHVVPAAPKDAGAGDKADLDAVRQAQAVAEERHREAFEDAGAYGYDQLLARFSQSAGTQLTVKSNPVLAYVLGRMLVDLSGVKGRNGVTIDGYVTVAKNRPANQRARPYLEDPALIPCEIDYLYPTGQQSYPSGHAANGMAAGLLMAKVMPERSGLIIARGVRYGDNRVVCAAHHPTDVAQGQLIAAAYFAALQKNTVFQNELACAIDERRSGVAHPVEPAARPDWQVRCQAVIDAAHAQGS